MKEIWVGTSVTEDGEHFVFYPAAYRTQDGKHFEKIDPTEQKHTPVEYPKYSR